MITSKGVKAELETVEHPAHYNRGKIEVIDFIEDQKLGFCEGNVVKYVSRAEHKGKQIEDLKKARFYLTWRIEQLEAEELARKVESQKEIPRADVVARNIRDRAEEQLARQLTDAIRIEHSGEPFPGSEEYHALYMAQLNEVRRASELSRRAMMLASNGAATDVSMKVPT